MWRPAIRDGPAADSYVPIPKGREPERAVEPRVFLVADAGKGELEEADDGREYLFARQPGPSEVCRDARADAREGPRELEQLRELALVAASTKVRVVAVLLASARIAPGCLDVAIVARADADVGPGRRDREPADASDGLRIVDALAV